MVLREQHHAFYGSDQAARHCEGVLAISYRRYARTHESTFRHEPSLVPQGRRQLTPTLTLRRVIGCLELGPSMAEPIPIILLAFALSVFIDESRAQ